MKRDRFLLILRAGPVWGPRTLGFVAATFGSAFDGELVSWGHSEHDVKHDRFRLRLFRVSAVPLARIAYTIKVILRGLRARWIHQRQLTIIAYDPFHSGFTAAIIKYLTGARFICEVNGVYWHPDNYLDLPDRTRAQKKQRRMVKFGAAVLRHADVVKLLYPDQLEGFRIGAPPQTVSFSDIVDSNMFVPSGKVPRKRVIFVGHPFLLKGVDLLLEAFDSIKDEFADWRLLLVGYAIEPSVRAHGYDEARVEILGPQRPEALRDLIEESALLVLPSRSEGMGRVLLEAALLGRPRIGSTVGGIPSVIEHGVDGLLFDSGDPASLAAALREVMSSPERARSMGEMARKRALREFTREAFLQHYQRVIESDRPR